MKKEQEALNYLYKIALTKNSEERDKKIEATKILQELIDSVDYLEYCSEIYNK